MSRHLRVRWLALILLLEAVVFLSVFDQDALMNAIKTPFNPLAAHLKKERRPLPRELPIEIPTVSEPESLPSPMPVLRSTAQFRMLTLCTFKDLSSLKKWDEKIFKGDTDYKILQENGASFLRSKSSDACSGLYIKTDYPATPDLYVSWRWRVISFPKKKTPANISNKKEDDFAARVYVIFPGSNFFKSDVIEYIWDEEVPIGTTASSPYSERVKLFVLRSGLNGNDASDWFEEERNIYEDYRKLFGKPPQKLIGAVALMSDSDNTGTSAEADFMEFAIKIKE